MSCIQHGNKGCYVCKWFIHSFILTQSYLERYFFLYLFESQIWAKIQAGRDWSCVHCVKIVFLFLLIKLIFQKNSWIFVSVFCCNFEMAHSSSELNLTCICHQMYKPQINSKSMRGMYLNTNETCNSWTRNV